MFFVPTSTANLSDFNDEYYEAEIAKKRTEMEALLH